MVFPNNTISYIPGVFIFLVWLLHYSCPLHKQKLCEKAVHFGMYYNICESMLSV